MAGKPETFVVKQVASREEWQGSKGPMVTYELLLEGQPAQPFKSHVPADKDPGLEDGATVEGWINEGWKFGLATGSPSGAQRSPNGSSGAGRDDATGRSIERQVAAKNACEALGPIDWDRFSDATYQAEYDARASWLTDVWARAIRAE